MCVYVVIWSGSGGLVGLTQATSQHQHKRAATPVPLRCEATQACGAWMAEKELRETPQRKCSPSVCATPAPRGPGGKLQFACDAAVVFVGRAGACQDPNPR